MGEDGGEGDGRRWTSGARAIGGDGQAAQGRWAAMGDRRKSPRAAQGRLGRTQRAASTHHPVAQVRPGHEGVWRARHCFGDGVTEQGSVRQTARAVPAQRHARRVVAGRVRRINGWSGSTSGQTAFPYTGSSSSSASSRDSTSAAALLVWLKRVNMTMMPLLPTTAVRTLAAAACIHGSVTVPGQLGTWPPPRPPTNALLHRRAHAHEAGALQRFEMSENVFGADSDLATQRRLAHTVLARSARNVQDAQLHGRHLCGDEKKGRARAWRGWA